MNFIQRAFAYLFRKKGKTISLFLTVFTVAVFLNSSFGILNASQRLKTDIRTSLGAAFYIRANTEVSVNENRETEVRENRIHITQKELDEIMQTGEIRYCNPINYGFAKSDAIQFIPGDKHTEENNMGKVTALRFSALASDFAEKNAVLARGKHITETDTGKILISEQLAEKNRLSVGDTLTLAPAGLKDADGVYVDEIPVKTARVQVLISGIYRLNHKDGAIRPTAGVPENKIYASTDVLDKLHESETGIYTGEAGFYITDPAGLDRIVRKVKALPSIDWTTHFIRTNDFQYSNIADRLSSLGSLVKILLVLVSAVSTAILTLLLTMRMRGRIQETGILLSIGIAKSRILAGFLLEVLAVTVFAFLLSYIVSFGITEFIGQNLFYGLHPDLLNDETLTAGISGSIPIENYMKLSRTEAAFLYLCQLIVITASAFLSSVMIMRLKPKEIL